MSAGPFRIEKPSAIVAMGETAPNSLGDYMARLITLIPGEALAAYLTIRSFWMGPDNVVTAGNAAGTFVDYLPAIGIIFLLVSRILGTRDRTGSFASVQWGGTVLAVIAFVLWVLAMGHRPFGWELDGRITSTLVVVFSFIVPYIYKGE